MVQNDVITENNEIFDCIKSNYKSILLESYCTNIASILRMGMDMFLVTFQMMFSLKSSVANSTFERIILKKKFYQADN